VPGSAGMDDLPNHAAASGLAPLPGDEPGSRRRLPSRVMAYWRLRAALEGVVVVGLGIVGALGLDWFTPVIRWVVVGLAAAWFFGVGVLVAPPIRRRLFWYSLSDSEIDVQHGWLVETRTVIPMSRVQHLKTEQGVLARRFRLADLHIHTAAGAIVLHGMDQAEADTIRGLISTLAGLSDDT
jgi:membrane protein YdbS with pleckstrin-like domain